MPMKGRFPIRRTLQYLGQGDVVFKDTVKVMTVNYNTHGKLGEGARKFVFFNIPQIQYKNPWVQIMMFKNMTPSPFLRFYLDTGEQVLVDIETKSNKEIMEHIKKILGKNEETLQQEEQEKKQLSHPAHFGPQKYCLRECICEVEGQISADGYEVENLISEDLTKRSRGFRTEYFIKPPVHVTVSFPFSVEICRINMDLSAGGGHSVTGLEMYTSASASRASWNAPEGQTLGPAEPSLPDKEAFTLVGKVLLKNQNQVVFSHRGFKARPPFGLMEATLPSPAAVAQELWNKGPLSLNHVAHLKICITHVTGSGIPCIKRLEVWGQPNKTCSPEVIDSVLLVASKTLAQDLAPQVPALPMESDCDPGGESGDRQAPSSLQELAEVFQDVPEEFLDPITLEIMPCPMLLPSGKVIDQATLEKCNRSEATWGRVPSDPFTGVAFTPHSQPLPHPSLKARIDQFLLQHSIPGCHLLGRAQTMGALTPSSIALPSRKRKMEQAEYAPDSSLDVNASCFSTTSLVSPTTSEHTAKKMKAANELGLTHMDCSTEPVSHEQKLSQSLEMALTSTLGSMPSFTARLTRGQLQHLGTRRTSTSWRAGTGPEQPGSVLGPECASCKRVFSSYFQKEPVYQLPCGHPLCRPCLGEKQRSLPMTCTACQQPFASQDVLRVHF